MSRRLSAALCLSLTLATLPAMAQDALPPPNPPEAQGLPFSAFLTETEMRLMFDYLRDAMIAVLKGEPYRMPPELAHTLARVQERLMRQGNAAVRQMMEMIQKDLDRALEEMRPPAPEPRLERTGT
ncbi:MAG: hypothetical protein ACK4TK_03100 [Thiobacillaceae bacterium]